MTKKFSEIREKVSKEKRHQKDDEKISEKISNCSKQEPSKNLLKERSIEDNFYYLRNVHETKIMNYKMTGLLILNYLTLTFAPAPTSFSSSSQRKPITSGVLILLRLKSLFGEIMSSFPSILCTEDFRLMLTNDFPVVFLMFATSVLKSNFDQST